MIDELQLVINALREELKQYGEMLARLDEQQSSVLGRRTEEIVQSVNSIQTQGEVITRTRQERERLQSDLAVLCQLGLEAPFSKIIPCLPGEYRPLLDALVQENNELLVRIQQRARQNHLLLRRSLEMMQTFLDSLLPIRRAPVYTETGNLFNRAATPASSALYEAVG